MSRRARVLCLDGGGIRGIVPAVVLAALERAAGLPAHRLFDLAAGTSSGGITACALALPEPPAAEAVLDLYVSRGREIFAPSVWRAARSAASGARYDHRPLERILGAVMGDAMLSRAAMHLLVPAYDLEARTGKFFKSWRAAGLGDQAGESPADADFAMRDVARATSAAPTLFEPAAVRSASGHRFVLVDGALVANNPTLCAIASARRLFPGAPSIDVVSIGCGEAGRPIRLEEARSWGTISWARPVLECLIDGASDTVDYQVRECFESEVRYFRLQAGPALRGRSDALDDASPENVRDLVLRGRALAERSAPRFAEIVPLLLPG